MQDKGITQSLGEKTKLPSEQDVHHHVERAASVWKDLEADDDGLVPISKTCSGLGGPAVSKFQIQDFASGQSAAAAAKPKRKPSRSTAAVASENPLLAAARARARSCKEFIEVKKSLEKAKSDATSLLDTVAVKLLGDRDKVESDPSLCLVKSRLNLVACMNVCFCRTF